MGPELVLAALTTLLSLIGGGLAINVISDEY